MALQITGRVYWDYIERIAGRIAGCGDYITGLDAATGDGDHWVNLNSGFSALAARRDELSGLPLPELFKEIAATLMKTIGGAGGVLYGTAYLAAAKKTAGQAAIGAAGLSEVLQAMADAIMQRGKSAPGNKTMVDAIVPAAAAMRAAVEAGKSEAESLEEMKRAALEGAESTRMMPALRGRAYYQADKGVGHLDPGAVTMSYQLETLCDSLLDVLRDEAALEREDPKAWNERGMAFFNDEFLTARQCFSRALALDPFNERYYHNRGRKGLSLDRFPEALADFQMVMRLNPEDDDSRHYCGVAYFFMGMYREAIAEFSDSLRLMVKNQIPLIPPTVDWTWMAYMRLGDKEGARRVLDEYITPDMPCDASDYDYKKRVLLYAGYTSPEDYEREIDNSDDVKGLTETYALALYFRYIKDDPERCRALLERVLAYPTSHHAFAYKLAKQDLSELTQ